VRRKQRGFTLLEIAVALAIITVLAGLAIGGIEAMKSRAAFSSNSGELIAGLRKTQAAATGKGTYTAFVIDTDSKKWWGVQLASPALDVSTFDPATATVVVSGQLDQNVSFPANGYGQALPFPFGEVPMVSGQSPALPYCSFCDASAHRGAVIFEPGGSLKTSGGPASAPGQQFVVQGKVGQTVRTIAVAVIARTGLIATFEK
jgi:prepilin-type N-terminal cleavage/methylation domain-containing protein